MGLISFINKTVSLETDVLILHTQKHHLYEFAVGVLKSNKRMIYVTPFYRKGLGGIVAKFPGNFGKKASGYWHKELPSNFVYSPFFWQFRKLVSQLFKRDIGFDFDSWCAKNLLAKKWRSKIVVTVQDYLPLTASAAKKCGCFVVSDQILNQSESAVNRLNAHYKCIGANKSNCLHDDIVNKTLIEISDLVTAPSLYTVSGFFKYNIPSSKIRIVPYGVDVYNPPEVQVIQNNCIRVICRANSVRKGGHLLLFAIQQCSAEILELTKGFDIEFVFLGRFEAALVEIFELVSNNLPNGVTITAQDFAHSEVKNLLLKSSFFVMPSLSEGMSLAALEAASARLPLIISKYCGFDGYNPPHPCLIVEDSVDSVAFALQFTFANRSKWGLWGSETRKFAMSRTWEIYQTNVSQLFSSIQLI